MRNNKILTCSLAALVTCFALSAKAQQNLPNLGEELMIGRIPIFVSPKGLSWFLPLALSVQIDCGDDIQDADANRTCIVRVMNNYSGDELPQLQALEKTRATSLMSLSPLDSETVVSVTDAFNTTPVGLFQKEMKLSTFVMQERGAYANGIFRIKQPKAQAFLNQFKTSGLGLFTSDVVIRGETVGEYLTIKDTDVLKSELSKLTGRYSDQELTKNLERIVNLLKVNAYGMDLAQAHAHVIEQLKIRFIGIDKSKKRGVFQDRVAAIEKEMILANDTSAPLLMKCTVSLALKESAVSTTRCEKVNP